MNPDHQMIEGESFGNSIALIESLLESTEYPALAPFLADCPACASPADSAKLPPAPALLPVLRWLPHIAAMRTALALPW